MPAQRRGAGGFLGLSEPMGLAWSMAAAGTSELLAAPAGSSEEPRARADIAVTGRDVRGVAD